MMCVESRDDMSYGEVCNELMKWVAKPNGGRKLSH